MIRPPPRSPLFPNPTLFRSAAEARDNQIPCAARNVLVTPAKHGIFLALQAIAGPGDEVLLPDPAWVSYEPMVQWCDARWRSEEHTSELQSRSDLVCRLLLEK